MGEQILMIGCGYREFREYALMGVASTYDIAMVTREEPSWQRPWITDHRVADLDDPSAVEAAARDMNRTRPLSGAVTWEEKLLETTAEVGAALGLPGLPVATARVARDKALQRATFAAKDVPSARFEVVTRLTEAEVFVETVGYPVVVKPRKQAGSVGVQVVHDIDQLAAALEFPPDHGDPASAKGVVVEEFLAGQEISVDCWCVNGEVEPYVIALKEIDHPPYCVEVGHVVGDVLPPSLRREVVDVVTRAHRAMGMTNALTHTEVMLTESGPRIVEVNARLGGDLIPWLAESYRPGLNIGTMLARVTLGKRPDDLPTSVGPVGIRFLHPSEDLTLDHIEVPESVADADWLVRWKPVRAKGETLRLPPRAFLDRAGYAVVRGDTPEEVRQRMSLAAERIRVLGTPAGEPAEAGLGRPG